MSGFAILDLLVGMFFIYFLLSMMNNSLFEITTTAAKLRSKHLEVWLKGTIEDQEIFRKIVDHPVLSGASRSGRSSSYMNAKQFAHVFIETICAESGNMASDLETIKSSIENSKFLSKSLQQSFLLYLAKAEAAGKLANAAKSDLEYFYDEIQGWYNSSMERLTGKMKRSALTFTAIFATVITLSGNVDSIEIMNYLYTNDDVRTELAAMGYSATDSEEYKDKVAEIRTAANDTTTGDSSATTAASDPTTELEAITREIDSSLVEMKNAYAVINHSIPIGWDHFISQRDLYIKTHQHDLDFTFWMKKIFGFVITILALCLGAPFWFDMLSKLANLRTSLKPKEQS